jgi:hypothetical protein
MRFLAALFVLASSGQSVSLVPSEYEVKYAPITEVSLADLVSWTYAGRGVRVRGWLDESSTLTDGPIHIGLAPVSAIASEFALDARVFMGQQVEVTGVFRDDETAAGSTAEFSILVWKYDGPGEKREKAARNFPQSLESLVMNPGRHDGETVRVVGQFRGRNLYGDLPEKSETGPIDWVLRNELYSVWVIAKEPRGSGWELDPSTKADTKKWLEVVGRVTTRQGITYIAPSKLSLVAAPGPPPPR